MRATLRITWFLFSLSLLFDSICPDNTQADPSVAQQTTTATPVIIPTTPLLLIPLRTTVKTDVTVNNVPVTDKAADASTAAATTDSSNLNAVTKQKPTDPLDPQTTVPTTGPVTAAAATTKPTPTQTQSATVTINPPPTPARPIAGVSPVVNVTSAASSEPNTTPPSKTSSSDSTGLPTRPGTTKIPEPSVTTKIPEVSTKLPTDPTSNGAPVITKGTTNSQTTGGGSHFFTPTASPADNKGGTKETPTKSQEPTPFKTTMPATTPAPNIPTRQPEAIDTTARTSPPQTTTIITTSSTTTSASPKKFIYSLLSQQETKEEEDLAKVCKLLMPNWLNGTCTLTWRHHNGKVQFDLVEIDGKVKTSQAAQYYEEITKKPTDNRTLIAILASCGALLIMIVILAVCASHHRKPYHENQQHLTEELHTVENGYHDNPTLEVMEVQPEMQEKKVALNGEFNDSWIVPIDNLLKEDLPDEEDTHL